MKEKIRHAKKLIDDAVKKYPRIAVACSFGKDSMVVTHLARTVKPEIPVFSNMTPFKPKESFSYIKRTDELLNLNVVVHYSGQEPPEDLKYLTKSNRLILHPDLDIKVRGYAEELRKSLRQGLSKKPDISIYELIPSLASDVKADRDLEERIDKYEEELKENLKKGYGDNPDEMKLYKILPSLCCDFYKTKVFRRALKDFDAWITGLRKDEGRTRIEYNDVEETWGGLVKVNPIIPFTKEEVFQYLKDNNIPLHPWYNMVFPDGKRYESLGCAPCTVPILPTQKERDGRWIGTSKCGGECGIHTQRLK
jgi:3'-phosphoadenosine 5'-phosphosulfate sulfotransferase (PAPS reductase)/FAD synthetase